MTETGHILHIYCVRYPSANPSLSIKFLLVISYSKNFKFACCLGGFHLWITRDLVKCGFFLFISHACAAFLKYTLRDQELYSISFNRFFLTNMIDNYLFSFLNYLWIFFTGNICNRKPMNHEFAFICLVLYFILTTFLFNYTAFKSGNLPSIFPISWFWFTVEYVYDFSNFILSSFMFFRKLPYHLMIRFCLGFKTLTPFRIHVC